MLLSEENLKYLGLIGLALIIAFVFYKCVIVNDKMIEGLTNNSSATDYASISTKLEGDIKIVKNVINIDGNSINDIYFAVKNSLMKKRKNLKKKNIYGTGKASEKIVRILEEIPLDQSLIQKQISY